MSERKHLVSAEVDRLIDATKGGRNAARDRCFLLLMFRHGLRVTEACALQLSQVDIESSVLHVSRLKKGLSTTHPLRSDEIKAIKAWLTIRKKMKAESDSFFLNNRRGALSRKTAWLAIRNYGEQAGLSLLAQPCTFSCIAHEFTDFELLIACVKGLGKFKIKVFSLFDISLQIIHWICVPVCEQLVPL